MKNFNLSTIVNADYNHSAIDIALKFIADQAATFMTIDSYSGNGDGMTHLMMSLAGELHSTGVIGTLGDINATDIGSRFGKHYDYQRLLGCANASMPGALVNLLLLLLATATARLAMIILCGAAWLHKQNMVFQQNVLH